MLKGKNIVLRPLQNSDFDFLRRIENDKENWQFGSEKKQFNKKELFAYIANARTDIKVAKQYRFVIDLNSVPIGFIDLFDYTIDSAGVGVIISKDHRNKGFAKESLKILTDHAFSRLYLFKLHCAIAKDNLTSIKVFLSCGFKLEREEKDLRYFVKFATS
tara:strand:- start:1113 stop:1592 length:480 start_codon:yes stop_codon:yes gene_type:complete